MAIRLMHGRVGGMAATNGKIPNITMVMINSFSLADHVLISFTTSRGQGQTRTLVALDLLNIFMCSGAVVNIFILCNSSYNFDYLSELHDEQWCQCRFHQLIGIFGVVWGFPVPFLLSGNHRERNIIFVFHQVCNTPILTKRNISF